MTDDVMTWAEFKKYVDAELEKQGISQDTYLWYIEIDLLNKKVAKEPVHVDADNLTGINIT